MGWLDRFKKRDEQQPGRHVVVIANADVARGMPRPVRPNFSDEPQAPCDKCGGQLEEVFITTGGPMSDAAIWREHPIAVDGWACVACGSFRYPRVIAVEQIHAWMHEGVTLGRAGKHDEAEQLFVRVLWDWPGYAPAHLNFAEATRSLLHAARDTIDAQTRRRFEQRMFEQYELGIDAYHAQPAAALVAPVSRAYLTLAEVALRNRAHERAQRLLGALLAIPELDAQDAERAREMVSYSEQRLDLFDAAGAVLFPRIKLMNEPKRAIETGDERKAIADALTDLEEHLRHAPDRWQSLWLYAKGLFAIERRDDGFAVWERAWQKCPDRIEIATDYSNNLLEADRVAEAHAVNRAITERHPEDSRLWCNLAVTHLLTGDIAAAEQSIAKSRQLDPNDPVAATVERRLRRGAPFPTTIRALEQGG